MACSCCGCGDDGDCQKWCRVTAGPGGPATQCDFDFSGIDGCEYIDEEWSCLKVFSSPGPCSENTEVQNWIASIEAICQYMSPYAIKVGYCCNNECQVEQCCDAQAACVWEFDPDGAAQWVLIEDNCAGVDCSCSGGDPPASSPNVYSTATTNCLTQSQSQALSAAGPGAELKAILSWLGFKASPGCKCNKRARYMDQMGCDWCEQNTDKIVGWLREEHERQKSIVPFIPSAVEQVVKFAIRRARKKGNSH